LTEVLHAMSEHVKTST